MFNVLEQMQGPPVPCATLSLNCENGISLELLGGGYYNILRPDSGTQQGQFCPQGILDNMQGYR